MLVVMTGLPGTGKSAVAEAVAKALCAPVFSVDPLEAVLLRAGIDREQRSDTMRIGARASRIRPSLPNRNDLRGR